MGMFRDMSKNFWGLRVCFLKSESIQAKNFQKVHQTYLFITTLKNNDQLKGFVNLLEKVTA